MKLYLIANDITTEVKKRTILLSTPTRCLAIHCEFGESPNDMLRERLICGIEDSRIQRRLLAEGMIDLTKAQELAL